jgi:hypothetical protein
MDELDLNPDLNHALQALSMQYPAMPRADAIEARLLVEFDACQRVSPRSLWLPAIGLALAASLAAIGFLRDRPAPRSAPDVFVAIPYTIPPAPYERTTVVRMDVEIAALMAAGFNIHAADASASIPADVLFGQDGRAVAIRPINVPIL